MLYGNQLLPIGYLLLQIGVTSNGPMLGETGHHAAGRRGELTRTFRPIRRDQRPD